MPKEDERRFKKYREIQQILSENIVARNRIGKKSEGAFNKDPAISCSVSFDMQTQAKTKTITFHASILKPPAILCSESPWSRFYNYLSYVLLYFIFFPTLSKCNIVFYSLNNGYIMSS